MSLKEFDEALIHHYRQLQPAAIKLTRSSEAAQDLLQDTVTKALANREKFREGTQLKAWLYTIMRNTFISQYHRQKRRNTFIDATENLYYLNDTSYTEDNKGDDLLLMGEIQRAVRKISRTQSTPFLLYYKGYRYREIAEMLDVPIGTIKNRIHLARKSLQELLGE